MTGQPLEMELLLTADQRRPADPVTETHRSECLRRIEGIVGPHGVQSWLRLPQPAFGGETAARMLQRDPARLLRHLVLLEPDGDDFDDVPDSPAQLRSEREAGRMLRLIDEVGRGVA